MSGCQTGDGYPSEIVSRPKKSRPVKTRHSGTASIKRYRGFSTAIAHFNRTLMRIGGKI